MVTLPPNYTDQQWQAMTKGQQAAAWEVAIAALEKALSEVVLGPQFSVAKFDALVDALRNAAEARANCIG